MNTKMAYISREELDYDLLIHGPCEPLWMINPTQLDSITGISSYNLALSHSDFADNFIHLYQYLKHQKAPKYLLLYITPESMDLRYNKFNTYRFADFLADSTVASIVEEMDPLYFKWSKLPFVRYAYYSNFINFKFVQGVKHFFQKRKTPYHENGYEAPAIQAWHYNLSKMVELYPKNIEFKWNSMREKYLIKLVKYAQKKGIKVIFYESPVFAPTISYQKNRGEFIEHIKNTAQSLAVDFWEFGEIPMSKNEENFFSTLNTTLKGSRIFTDTLGKHIRQNLLCE
ncbi:MAG: hypothetical protein R2798_04745 [Chitinophagales bacterium]|nr:hypothetical protein [Bacteroidota bacterium]MCB9042778.1 hypothetical protein [Chitinophagales bacterium]